MSTTTLPTADYTAAIERMVQFFEAVSPHNLDHLGEFYEPQARFKDPFNEVVGIPAIQHIFAHMFVQLEQPRFVVTTQVLQGQQCFLTWEFRFCFKGFKTGQTQTILGATHLVLNEAGFITLHRDYWDAAEELYEKLPVLGGLMRWLKRRASS
ncbi:nuclear transport factor 2 family protein [Rhodoferax sp. U11-2br]|uniref:nuclear transport factor 2 family protein n=1 Tax=Rhodoferax sp. U11-2br TaxID=2838878 RepID=UPI001BE52AB5|nr:nuclear transport factor 2 family protein [Rhodoferax sp. U11-2br]MBT3065437.1 nuclear transport factor 2 family protein [Rhodoferax sp. U11-2br]